MYRIKLNIHYQQIEYEVYLFYLVNKGDNSYSLFAVIFIYKTNRKVELLIRTI